MEKSIYYVMFIDGHKHNEAIHRMKSYPNCNKIIHTLHLNWINPPANNYTTIYSKHPILTNKIPTKEVADILG